jgi:hypothetical protein
MVKAMTYQILTKDSLPDPTLPRYGTDCFQVGCSDSGGFREARGAWGALDADRQLGSTTDFQ